MDLKELWIGDKVYVKSFKANGIWEGLDASGKAKVKFKSKVFLIDLIEIKEAIEETEELIDIIIEKNPIQKIDPLRFENSIDLHIAKLNPDIEHQLPELILNFQLSACKNYIEKAVSINKSNFTIVHGKGKGVLKQEVLHLLKSFPQYKYHIEKKCIQYIRIQ
ncbi:MAG: Smr/MutS family protein [Bacteroidota bacterium]